MTHVLKQPTDNPRSPGSSTSAPKVTKKSGQRSSVEGLVQEFRQLRAYRPKKDNGNLSPSFIGFKHVFNSYSSLWVKGLCGNPYPWVEAELATGTYELADPDTITLQHLMPAAKKRKSSSK
jgi:hypothetical protein